MPAPASITEQLDNLYSSTWQKMRDEAVDNIMTATPLFYWLYNGDRVRREEGGRWIGVQLMYAKNTTVKSLGPGGTIDVAMPEHTTTAQVNWKFVAGSVVRQFAEETWNRGKHAIYNKVKNDLKNLELSMIDALETQAFSDGTGNGSLDLTGLQALVDTTPATGVVQGIDPSTATWWQNKARAYSVTSMPSGDKGILFNFRRVYNDCSVGNDHPTLMIGDVNSYEVYEAKVTTLLQVTKTRLADAGFDVLSYKGCPFTHSPSVGPSGGTVYFLNERYIELVINAMADFYMTPWKAIPNQLDRVAQVVVEGNLAVNNRRMHGVLHTIGAGADS